MVQLKSTRQIAALLFRLSPASRDGDGGVGHPLPKDGAEFGECQQGVTVPLLHSFRLPNPHHGSLVPPSSDPDHSCTFLHWTSMLTLNSHVDLTFRKIKQVSLAQEQSLSSDWNRQARKCHCYR